MPTYTYQCPACNEIVEEFRSVNERYSVKCACGQAMEIVILAPPNHPKEMLPHFDRGLGCEVRDRADRQRIMDAKGLKEAGDSDHPTTKWLKEVREQDAERNHRR